MDSASNRNVYQECLLGVKAAVATLPTSCADCFEIWELLPPGVLRACPGLYLVSQRDGKYTGNQEVTYVPKIQCNFASHKATERGKAMANYTQELAQDAVCQSQFCVT